MSQPVQVKPWTSPIYDFPCLFLHCMCMEENLSWYLSHVLSVIPVAFLVLTQIRFLNITCVHYTRLNLGHHSVTLFSCKMIRYGFLSYPRNPWEFLNFITGRWLNLTIFLHVNQLRTSCNFQDFNDEGWIIN